MRRRSRYAARHDVAGFLAEELERRRELGYPPFRHLISIVASGTDAEAPSALLRELNGELQGADLLGPAPLCACAAAIAPSSWPRRTSPAHLPPRPAACSLPPRPRCGAPASTRSSTSTRRRSDYTRAHVRQTVSRRHLRAATRSTSGSSTRRMRARRRVALAQIRQYPDAVLRMRAREVEQFDDDLARLAEKMAHLMHDARGVGLAATQVGVLQRMFVFQLADERGGDDDRQPRDHEAVAVDGGRRRGLPLAPGRARAGGAAGRGDDRGPGRHGSAARSSSSRRWTRASSSTSSTTSTACSCSSARRRRGAQRGARDAAQKRVLDAALAP